VTTIAWDGKNLACDSRSLTNDTIDQCETQKIFKKSGVYYCLAGEYAQALAVMDYLVTKKNEPVFPKPEYQVLVISDTAQIFDGELHPSPVEPPYAMGTGAQFAYGAILSGKTAKEAVEVAIKLDPYSGGKIRTHKT